MEEKQKLPKPKLTKEIKEKLQIILTKRLERYPKVIVNDVLLSVTKTNVI
jgi:SET domain-containing protein 6